ncbi:MAG: bifunctional riboflavin kinase/FAD synthetase [Candidatus Eremiobacteraeota bacterium]|nr:bifunctional riboflavin kinase/FAD synthetase [Candidatus Eremiobacteraeota bacterium]
MQIIELNKIRRLEGPTSLALGFFDGIHLGHRRILEKARRIAKEKGYQSGIFTFYRHPVEVLQPGFCFHYLTTLEEREKIIESLGLDYFLILPFSKEVKSISPEDFIENLIIGRLNARAVVVGKDYKFGRDAGGNIEMLKEKLEPRGIEVHVMDEVLIKNEKIGSTIIRNDITSGLIDHANKGLGRWYSIEGIVRSGNKRGRKLGIPTANLDLPDNKVIPPEGVYCVFALLNGKLFKGVGNMGSRPTFGEYHPTFEVHIMDFSGDIYGEKIRVFFVNKVRDIIKFDTAKDLVKRIKTDINICSERLSKISIGEMEINFKCCPGIKVM